MPSREAEIAWAAGIFEGEGCIQTSNGKRDCTITLSLGMTDEDVVKRFSQLTRKGKIGSKQERGKHKDIYVWRAYAKNAVDILEELRPWLGERRGQKADAAVAWWYEKRLECLKPRNCSWCGVEFSPVKYNAAAYRKIYCTLKCQSAAMGARDRQRRRDGIRGIMFRVNCSVCGKEYMKAESSMRRWKGMCRPCANKNRRAIYYATKKESVAA